MRLRKLISDMEEENSQLAHMKLSLEESCEQVTSSVLTMYICKLGQRDKTFFLFLQGELEHLGQVQWPEAAERADLQAGWTVGFWNAGKALTDLSTTLRFLRTQIKRGFLFQCLSLCILLYHVLYPFVFVFVCVGAGPRREGLGGGDRVGGEPS